MNIFGSAVPRFDVSFTIGVVCTETACGNNTYILATLVNMSIYFSLLLTKVTLKNG